MSPLLQHDAGGYIVVVRPGIYTNGAPCFIAEHPELQGCEAAADSPEKARELLDEARALYLRVLRDNNEEIPAPRQKTSPIISWISAEPASRPTPGRAQPAFADRPLLATTF